MRVIVKELSVLYTVSHPPTEAEIAELRRGIDSGELPSTVVQEVTPRDGLVYIQRADEHPTATTTWAVECSEGSATVMSQQEQDPITEAINKLFERKGRRYPRNIQRQELTPDTPLVPVGQVWKDSPDFGGRGSLVDVYNRRKSHFDVTHVVVLSTSPSDVEARPNERMLAR